MKLMLVQPVIDLRRLPNSVCISALRSAMSVLSSVLKPAKSVRRSAISDRRSARKVSHLGSQVGRQQGEVAFGSHLIEVVQRYGTHEGLGSLGSEYLAQSSVQIASGCL
jgi:hypothetical protein